jgi:hypothetical protein
VDKYYGTIANGVSHNIGENSYNWIIPWGSNGGSMPANGNNIIVEVTIRDGAGNIIKSNRSDNPLTISGVGVAG